MIRLIDDLNRFATETRSVKLNARDMTFTPFLKPVLRKICSTGHSEIRGRDLPRSGLSVVRLVCNRKALRRIAYLTDT